MISKIKKKARRLLERARLYKESYQDATRYFRAASWAGPTDIHKAAHMEADLIKHYHVVEKGLAMPEFRAGFGEAVVVRLGQLLQIWVANGGSKTHRHYLASCEVLRAYELKHQELGVDVSQFMPEGYSETNIGDLGDLAGVRLAATKVSESACVTFDKLVRNRHSVRTFRQDLIPDDQVIMDAISVAISAPSVCNRSTWRVHIYRDEKAQEVLHYQNGNRGFGHLTPIVLLITSDMRSFSEVIERFQPWIEGGVFSMLLILALHARGVASVALNCSQKNAVDVAMRKVGGIPDHERIIMLLACGYPAADAVVPRSCRHDVEHFITRHG